MLPFEYLSPETLRDAQVTVDHAKTMALAGGTTLIDLMKLNVLRPVRLVFVKPILDREVRMEETNLVIGAGCSMADLADSEPICDAFPAVRQSLILAASPQIRNMATIGGNLLQRTRSTYFRHPGMPANAEFEETNLAQGTRADATYLAVLGNDGRLVGTYPGDFGVALIAFDGQIEISGTESARIIPARQFFQLPQGQETQYTMPLQRGELITKIIVPLSDASGANSVTRRSIYLKIRERSSYAFALASAAIGLELDGGGPTAAQTVRSVRIGLGGLGSIPWHCAAAEEELLGKQASDANFRRAAEAALADALPPLGTEYKVTLAKRVLVRALQILRDQGALSDQQLWTMQHGRHELEAS